MTLPGCHFLNEKFWGDQPGCFGGRCVSLSFCLGTRVGTALFCVFRPFGRFHSCRILRIVFETPDPPEETDDIFGQFEICPGLAFGGERLVPGLIDLVDLRVGEFSRRLDDPSVSVGLHLVLAGFEPSIEDLLEFSGVVVTWADLDLKPTLGGRFWGHGVFDLC